MAARDRYNRDFTCKNCGEKGVVHISEDDYPFMRGPGRDVDGVEGNISAEMSGEFEIKVTCQGCGVQEFLFKRS
jgi:hypothetical protein